MLSRSTCHFIPILPVNPVHFQVSINGLSDGEKEIFRAEFCEKALAFKMIFYGAFHFRKTEFHARPVQIRVELGQGFSGCNVDIRHRFSRNDNPLYRCGGDRDRLQDMFVEDPCVGEEQRRIPPKQHQSGDELRLRVSRDIVITLQPVHTTQHSVIRPPSGLSNLETDSGAGANPDCPDSGEGDPTGTGAADSGEKDCSGDVDVVEERRGVR
jgi:hypothetical protein